MSDAVIITTEKNIRIRGRDHEDVTANVTPHGSTSYVQIAQDGDTIHMCRDMAEALREVLETVLSDYTDNDI